MFKLFIILAISILCIWGFVYAIDQALRPKKRQPVKTLELEELDNKVTAVVETFNEVATEVKDMSDKAQSIENKLKTKNKPK